MATVGRARQTAESLINSQLSRALYGEASEKDILLQYNAFCIGLLGTMLRKLTIFKEGKVVHMVAMFLHHLLGAMLRKLTIFKEKQLLWRLHQFSNLTFNNMGRCDAK